MIIRISTEGQYELGEDSEAAFTELENKALEACQASDEDRFKQQFGQLLELIRTQGKPVGDDQLVGSELILPPPDISLEEARAEFTGEGLIPG